MPPSSSAASRPPQLCVDDDAPVRRDVLSGDVRAVHPEVAAHPDADRVAHLRDCDERAYATIRDRFPAFTPPGWNATRPRPPLPPPPPAARRP